MKKMFGRAIALMLTLILLAGICSTAVFAKEVPSKTLKNRSYSEKVSAVDSLAKTAKVGKLRIVMPSRGMGYLKFTAPKKGTYDFTVSDIKKYAGTKYGFFQIMTIADKKGKTIKPAKVRTYGGHNNTMWIGPKVVKYYYAAGQKITLKSNNWTLKSRIGRIKLKKGQVVYLYFKMYKKDSMLLSIKQK